MSFDKLFKLVDDKTQSFIQNLSSGYIEVPYIMSETLKILEDDSVFCNIVSDSNKKSLCIMLDQYFSDCWSMYIDDMKLDKLLKYGKIEIYKPNVSGRGIDKLYAGKVQCYYPEKTLAQICQY